MCERKGLKPRDILQDGRGKKTGEDDPQIGSKLFFFFWSVFLMDLFGLGEKVLVHIHQCSGATAPTEAVIKVMKSYDVVQSLFRGPRLQFCWRTNVMRGWQGQRLILQKVGNITDSKRGCDTIKMFNRIRRRVAVD